ncbi:MAG: tRNA glutamyl-Q(34) synthetase GluQRS [Gammaproteobacteria bacterium]|nr:tRNA glutamyl-Q(34) synthetase GluQRS [Gammaproteobacteria bacterium]
MYRGRFAPSPTGQLHFGSLVAAVASYLDAKAHSGEWMVRIEDLDPPREVPGSAKEILNKLEAFSLFWDGDIMWQSQRHKQYDQALKQLAELKATYLCDCTRKMIQESGGVYQNSCRGRLAESFTPDRAAAIRLQVTEPLHFFSDRLQGKVINPPESATEDFVLRRRDQLYAYQLAVVVDDIEQQITHVVRGADLIDSTFKHWQLYQYFGAPFPSYLHIPLAVSTAGQKLSKQNYAPAINSKKAQQALIQAFHFLGLTPEKSMETTRCSEILQWGVEHWSENSIPPQLSQSVPTDD